jgi:hypothetical protein
MVRYIAPYQSEPGKARHFSRLLRKVNKKRVLAAVCAWVSPRQNRLAAS